MVIRNKMFSTIMEVFKRHEAVTVRIFESKEISAGKYSEDNILIYDLAEQGGEICSFRYSPAVPYARQLTINSNVQDIKCCHITNVNRPYQSTIMTKGE